ncbi:MAG: DUF6263 family protein [Bacteroidia bacterium]|nr:DUF6263 family protein [Bacteroidia bacterium]
MKATRILLFMALILAAAVQAEAKKVKLQYHFKSGDQFKYEMNLSQETAQEVMGQSQITTLSNSHVYEFKVIEVTPAGDFVINVALAAFAMSTATPMGDMKYNSATDTIVPDFAKGMAVSLNEVYSFTLSPLGKITDVKAPEGIVEKVNKAMENLGGVPMQIASASAGASASAEGFQKILEGLMLSFPDGGAELKKPWEVESKTNQMISFKVLTKLELMKSSEEGNVISVKAQISQDPDSPPMDMQGMNLTFELLGAKDGTLLLDQATGLINSAETTTSMSGTISIDSPQLQSPMSIPMTIRSAEKIVKK